MKPNELDALIEDCLEGRLSEADAARLSAELQESPAARTRYWESASIHGLLEHTLEQASLRVITSQAAPRPTRWLQWRPLAAAAVFIALLGISALWWPRQGIVVEIVKATSGVSTEWSSGSRVRLKEVKLVRGEVRLRLASGVLLDVRAPAEVKLMDAMQVRLLAGRVSAVVPVAARGFTVETPAGRVTDLGTRFGVEAGPTNVVEVHVFEGRVEVTTSQQQHVQLAAGDAATLDPLQGVTNRMAAVETKFIAGVQTVPEHLDNPFVGATFYRNVDYTAEVSAAANLKGGVIGQQMRRVADYPTFVWLDSIAAVNGTGSYAHGLAGHLDQALLQGANAIGIVIYDMPNRDGSALASNGELLVAQNGLNRYKAEYIDVIYRILSQSKYDTLRIVMVIEPDSLPNLITNLNFPRVAEAYATGAYVQGVQYAIGTLRSLSNTYAYMDVAHAGWMGWKNNLKPFAALLKQVGAGIAGGNSKVDGFISNTANYNVFAEPYLTAGQKVKARQVRALQGWYDMNDHIDEQSYANALRTALITGSDAYPASVGLLLDTSRNGWGGSKRPTGPSTSADLRTFVRESTLDKRTHKGNWGNQRGAGIGARPVAAPAPNYHAFVWVKPPGQSDGSSTLIPTGPENPDSKGFDRMCDPTYQGNSLNGHTRTGALPNAPVAGRWFQVQFEELVRNAFPPFSVDAGQ
jgi:cellulase/cellobiase CelA1/ferric-dicitrate binding protein FerR (iron transport regulator)